MSANEVEWFDGGTAMGDELAGRVALVTGASRGIGKAIAHRFAAEGASVAICSRPTPGMSDYTLERAEAEIAELGGRVFAFHADLSDADTNRRPLAEEVAAELGPVDILVNNAAAGGFNPFLEWTDEAIERAIQVNFWAPWNLTRGVLPTMREAGAGWIINLSSATALQPPGPPFPKSLTAWAGTIYGGTKAFLDRWTISLAAEVQPDGIAVNTLAPQAAAATEMLLANSALPEHLYEPLDTMAEAALALGTADPATLTGQVTFSLSLLAQLQRPTRALDGVTELADWAPGTLTSRIESMTANRKATGPRDDDANPFGIPSGPKNA